LVSLVQLFVPAIMIWEREDVLKTGTEYKFESRPVDPTDPFRGKYVVLNYTGSSVKVTDPDLWTRGEEVFALLSTDANGYARVDSLLRNKPKDGEPYLKTKIRFTTKVQNTGTVTLDFHFDRLYMEESKAYPAEKIYVESRRDASSTTYALVNIKEGSAVLKDVMIDGESINEIVKRKMLEEEG